MGAFVMEEAKARLMSRVFGDEDTMDAVVSRVATSTEPESPQVLEGVKKVKEDLDALDGSSCEGKECALKQDNADLQSKIEKGNEEQRNFLQANFSGASLSATDGLDALVLANVTAGQLKVEECKQTCMMLVKWSVFNLVFTWQTNVTPIANRKLGIRRGRPLVKATAMPGHAPAIA